jgi:hypothetical protein
MRSRKPFYFPTTFLDTLVVLKILSSLNVGSEALQYERDREVHGLHATCMVGVQSYSIFNTLLTYCITLKF